MNVLPLIISILMVLGMYSHLYLERYKKHRVIAQEYKNYMIHHEAEGFNHRQQALYNRQNKNTDNKRQRNGATSGRINIKMLLNEDEFQKEPFAPQHLLVLKRLLICLYGQTEFFKALEEERGDFLDEFLSSWREVAKSWKKFETKADLNKFKFEDEGFENFYYHIVNASEALFLKERDNEFGEQSLHDSKKDFKNIKSFLDTKNNKINAYLAPKELLMALFDDDAVVESFIKKRDELYNLVNKKIRDEEKKSGRGSVNQSKLDAFANQWREEASQVLSQFRNQKIDGLTDEFLEFKVTGTNPKKYK